MSDAVAARGAPPCVACGAPLVVHLEIWLLRCPRCGLRASTLADDAVDAHTPGAWDARNARAFTALRDATARRLLDEIAALLPLTGKRLLDVGCGPAWFIAAAGARGVHALGLEPHAPTAAEARARGLEVLTGRFPDDLPDGIFDVITFNDVFEHLDDPDRALASLRDCLAQDGLVVVNAPSRGGMFYRVAELLARTGWTAPLERLWQRGFVSPHLFYFDAASLDALFGRAGFTLRRRFSLPTLARAGLWGRIRAGGRLPLPLAALVWGGCQLVLPLLALLPADIVVQVYARDGAPR